MIAFCYRFFNALHGKMRTGFQNAVIGSCGVYTCTGGVEERELAKKYRIQAEETEAQRFHRLAETFREISTFYERDAEREASRELDN